METQIKIHPVQAKILVSMLFRKEARFSQLNTTGLTNDHFAFHINSLVDSGLIEKLQNKAYKLTSLGKEFANRFDTENKNIERQAKIGVLIVCIKSTDKDTKYLLQQRLKQPYFGFWGFITGKIKWGEEVLEAAGRELKEETGLLGKVEFAGIKHKMDYTQKSRLLEDKYFFVIRAVNPKGKLVSKFEGGKNKWMREEEIDLLPDLFDGVMETIHMATKKKLSFVETKYKVKRY